MKWKRVFAVSLCVVSAIFFSLQAHAATKPVELCIEVENTVEGDTPPSSEEFTFLLQAVDGAPMPEKNTITISGTDTGRFLPITYTEPETSHYILREVPGNTKGYIYDDRIYDVTVMVTTDDEGILHTAMYVCEQGSEWKTGTVKFVNKYKDPSVSDSEESGKPENPNAPDTGDHTNLIVWGTLGSMALLVLIEQFVLFKKNQNKKDS